MVSVEDGVGTYELCCFSLGVVGVQVFLQLQHTKLQSLQQSTRDELQQQDRTPHTLTHNNGPMHTQYMTQKYLQQDTHIQEYTERAAQLLQNDRYVLLTKHDCIIAFIRFNEIITDDHAEQPHRLSIQQHSGTLGARRHDFEGAEELISHSLEPLPKKANRWMCDGAKFPLNILH